jgi:hypothetical protein
LDFSTGEWVAVVAIFVWSGFVRTGIGFGGAALGLPLLLLVRDDPLLFLPIIATHLLIFSTLTAGGRLKHIDWGFVKRAMSWMILPKLAGVIGLLSLPPAWMAIFVFSVSVFYAATWIVQHEIRSHSPWVDRALLVIGGYVSGASLVGAPLIAAVAIRHVALNAYRDTLFALWFLLVTVKMSAFVVAEVPLHFELALWLLLPAGIGHLGGLRVHRIMLGGDAARVKFWLGIGLLTVSLAGLYQVLGRG